MTVDGSREWQHHPRLFYAALGDTGTRHFGELEWNVPILYGKVAPKSSYSHGRHCHFGRT
jgi:hypothetical protein